MKHITKVLRVSWEIKNEKMLREENGAVIVVNHQSSLDILAMYHMCCVAKNIVVPFGFVLYLSRCIFIDRSKPKDAHNILKSSADSLFENKTNILILPRAQGIRTLSRCRLFNKGHVTIQCLESVPTAGLTMDELPELLTKVQNSMDLEFKN